MRNIKKSIVLLIIIFCFLNGQTRQEIDVPNIPGYQTLVGDFHMHTLFSDGNIWPSVRVEEAYREGLDVISITDHVEYKAYVEDVPINYGRSYELALPKAKELGILLIKGAEITRSMPPGHFNALFIKDIEPLTNDDPLKAIEIAVEQGAYLIWNHPGWGAQLKDDGVVRWYDEHTELFNKGYINGIEVVNETEYYPEVFQWALDKNLTFFGNSDVHGRVDFLWEPLKGMHRPYTLVFAKENSIESVREAFEAMRTIIYNNDQVIGKEELVSQFFNACIYCENTILTPDNSGNISIQIENKSDIPLELSPKKDCEFTLKKGLNIKPGTSERVRLNIPLKFRSGYQNLKLKFKVNNFLVEPEKGLEASLDLAVLNLNGISLEHLKKDNYHFEVPELPKDISLHFTLDGSTPTKNSQPMSETLKLTGKTLVEFAAFKNGKMTSDVYTKSYNLHKGLDAEVTIVNLPNPKYAAIGEKSLVDGITGNTDYSKGNWLGFEQDDLDATLQFKKSVNIDKITLRFLEKNKSWIFMPKTVEVEISKNGKDYQSLYKWEKEVQTEASPESIVPLEILIGKSAKYIRIKAENQQTCPDWHQGAGGKSWMFIDEIIVE